MSVNTYKPKSWKYGVHPSVAIIQKWLNELEGKTGKSLEQWMKIIGKSPVKENKARLIWLKETYGLGTNTASWLVDRANGKIDMDETPEAYFITANKWVDDMFAGPKQDLLPLYDKIMEYGYAIRKDVRACPCRTMVPFYRSHVFAQIKPSTRTRIDIGLALKGVGKVPARLVDTGGEGKGDRITHRIPVTRLDEIDSFVVKWLKTAYELDAK